MEGIEEGGHAVDGGDTPSQQVLTDNLGILKEHEN
jgi:hypothetical protein